jgi:hypothetical protein
MSHGVYDPTQQVYLLWVARRGVTPLREVKPLDLCIMLDFKKRNCRKQPAAWAFLIPASLSLGFQDVREKKFRILIGNYHSKIMELFIGYRDGVPSISTGKCNYIYRIASVTPATTTKNTLLTFDATGNYGGYQDITGGTPGTPIVGTSGARKGKFMVLKRYDSTNTVEVDEDLYGTCPFVAGDLVTIGGMQAYWGGHYNEFGSENILKRGSRQKGAFIREPFTNLDT